MLAYELGERLQKALQPFVVFGDNVLAKTVGPGAGVGVLRTAAGVEHKLRRLCSRRVLQEHQARAGRAAVQELVSKKFRELTALDLGDPLVYFLWELLPAVQGYPNSSQALVSSGAAALPPDIAAALEGIAESLPEPEIPAPSLWVLGRVWPLVPGAPVRGAMNILVYGQSMVLAGKPVAVQSLREQWLKSAMRHVNERTSELAAAVTKKPEAMLREASEARERLARDGFVQYGDYIYIDGHPPRVGHILPPHYNRSLGRETNRDVALALELRVPPSPPGADGLSAVQRNGAGRWETVALPHSRVCPGRNPPAPIPDAPGRTFVNYLTWAAIRCATNGRFHEWD